MKYYSSKDNFTLGKRGVVFSFDKSVLKPEPGEIINIDGQEKK